MAGAACRQLRPVLEKVTRASASAISNAWVDKNELALYVYIYIY